MSDSYIVSVTGIVVPPTRDAILIGNRAKQESFWAGERNRIISERLEREDRDLIDALSRGFRTEAGVALDVSSALYLGDTRFSREDKHVFQVCFGAIASSYPSPIPNTLEMVNQRFIDPTELISILRSDDPYELKMKTWITRARDIGLLR